MEVFLSNKTDGSTFLALNSSDLKELGIVALGDRKKPGEIEKQRRYSQHQWQYPESQGIINNFMVHKYYYLTYSLVAKRYTIQQRCCANNVLE